MSIVAFEQGLVESVEGPVVALRVEPACPIFARFEARSGAAITVVQRLGPQHVRAIADDLDHGLVAGDRPGRRAGAAAAGLADAVLFAAIAALAPPLPGDATPIETGIKAIDLLCPLAPGAVVSIIGGPTVGRLTMVEELHRRLGQTRCNLTVVFLIVPRDAHTIPRTLADQTGSPADDGGGVRTIWIISPRADDPSLAQLPTLGAARMVFTPSSPARGLWPAIDPHTSRSSVAVGEAHATIAARTRAALRKLAELRADPSFDALARAREYAAAGERARRRDAELLERLSASERASFAVGRQLERYLAQPFYTAERLTGVRGTHVPMASTLETCLHCLAGDRTPNYDYPDP